MSTRSTSQTQATEPGSRRRVLTAAAALPLLGFGLTLGPYRMARAAPDNIPAPVRALDAAAMALFDAAQTAHWTAARRALDQARASATASATIEDAFLAAGGEMHRFFEARNNLTADLIEAATALAQKDKRWLINCADRLATRAGELSQPFAVRANAVAPRIESLLFLARRMRRALVWHDTAGFRSAHEDFKRLWESLRGALASQPTARLAAFNNALAHIANSRSAADVDTLYVAVRQLRDGLR